MVRGNDLCTGSVNCINHLPYNVISCKDLYVNNISIAGCCNCFVKFGIFFCGHWMYAALFVCTECTEKRSITHYITKFFYEFCDFCNIFDIFIPVHTPFHQIHMHIKICTGKGKDVLFCLTDIRNADCRNSVSKFQISYFYSVHRKLLLNLHKRRKFPVFLSCIHCPHACRGSVR